MNSMIIADISQGNVYPTNYKLYQYDYGRILRLLSGEKELSSVTIVGGSGGTPYGQGVICYV